MSVVQTVRKNTRLRSLSAARRACPQSTPTTRAIPHLCVHREVAAPSICNRRVRECNRVRHGRNRVTRRILEVTNKCRSLACSFVSTSPISLIGPAGTPALQNSPASARWCAAAGIPAICRLVRPILDARGIGRKLVILAKLPDPTHSAQSANCRSFPTASIRLPSLVGNAW